jgi:hypothetical protein
MCRIDVRPSGARRLSPSGRDRAHCLPEQGGRLRSTVPRDSGRVRAASRTPCPQAGRAEAGMDAKRPWVRICCTHIGRPNREKPRHWSHDRPAGEPACPTLALARYPGLHRAVNDTTPPPDCTSIQQRKVRIAVAAIKTRLGAGAMKPASFFGGTGSRSKPM